jgi:hypothetical protein
MNDGALTSRSDRQPHRSNIACAGIAERLIQRSGMFGMVSLLALHDGKRLSAEVDEDVDPVALRTNSHGVLESEI